MNPLTTSQIRIGDWLWLPNAQAWRQIDGGWLLCVAIERCTEGVWNAWRRV